MIWLTKQEEMILLAVFHIGEGAYLVNVREYLNEHTGKDWAYGSLYMTLESLRRRNLLEARTGLPTSVRGGKAIKFYELTVAGHRSLTETKEIQDGMWRGYSAPVKIRRLS
jgi:PadR family transcriptional regulator, regulatory protein PadR